MKYDGNPYEITQKERYWELMEQKNQALAEAQTISAEIAKMKESLNRADLRYQEAEASAQAAYWAMTDEEREEVRNTNTWGNS